jgi:hypothetical protein
MKYELILQAVREENQRPTYVSECGNAPGQGRAGVSEKHASYVIFLLNIKNENDSGKIPENLDADYL